MPPTRKEYRRKKGQVQILNKSKVQQIKIAPWFIATAENVIGTYNGYVYNFPNAIILSRFVQIKVVSIKNSDLYSHTYNFLFETSV